MTRETVDIKDAGGKNPFRVFSKIEYNWYKAPEPHEGLDFYIRPLKASELAMYRSIEKRLAKEESKLYREAIERCGYTWEDIHGDISGKTKKVREEAEAEQNRKFVEVSGAVEPISFSLNMEIESAMIDVLSFAVSKVRSGEDEEEVTRDMLESINSVTLMAWLAKTLKDISTLTDAERVSL